MVTGFCTAALYTIAGSWINAKVPNDIRGRVLSLYMVTSFIVLGAGQLLLNLSAPIPDPGERLGDKATEVKCNSRLGGGHASLSCRYKWSLRL